MVVGECLGALYFVLILSVQGRTERIWLLAYGSSGAIYACLLRLLDGTLHPARYAVKRGITGRINEEESMAHEALMYYAPSSVVPLVGRVYSKGMLSGIITKYMPSDFHNFIARLRREFGDPVDRWSVHPHVVRWYTVDILVKLLQIHLSGFCHSDIKSENILVDEDGYICFTDFGACKEESEENWRKEVHGTAYTTAPERLDGNGIWDGPRWPADLWSVGVIMHDLLFGDTVGHYSFLLFHTNQ